MSKLLSGKYRSAESGLGHGYNLHPDAPGFRLSERGSRLGHSAGAGLTPVEYL